MQSKTILNKKYADLCARLGDLEMNREKIAGQISKVRQDILTVEAALSFAQEVEDAVRMELAPAKDDDKRPPNE